MDFSSMIFTTNTTHCARDKQQKAANTNIMVRFSVFQVNMKASKVRKEPYLYAFDNVFSHSLPVQQWETIFKMNTYAQEKLQIALYKHT